MRTSECHFIVTMMLFCIPEEGRGSKMTKNYERTKWMVPYLEIHGPLTSVINLGNVLMCKMPHRIGVGKIPSIS